MGEEVRSISADIVRYLQLSDTEIISRPYGRLYLISARDAGLKNLQALLMIIEPGKQTSKHYHPSEEIFFVVKGEALFKGRILSQQLKAQDTIIVPPNEPHQIENISSTETCEILIALSPPRKPEQVTYCD